MPIERTPQNKESMPIGRTPRSVSFARTLDYSDVPELSWEKYYRRDPNSDETPFIPLKYRKVRLTDDGRDELVIKCRELITEIEEELDTARNLKTTIKDLVKEKLKVLDDTIVDLGEYVEPKNLTPGYHPSVRTQTSPELQVSPPTGSGIEAVIERMAGMLQQNTDSILEIKNLLHHPKPLTYSEVASGGNPDRSRLTLHSVAVSSAGLETGEEILDQVREAVSEAASEGGEWVKVEKIRKAKDRKVIVSCNTKEERRKLRERIERKKHLQVEEIENKDPLVILRNILKKSTNEEIVDRIRKQNRKIFEDITEEEIRISVKFRKPAKNQLLSHVVATVSPKVWNRLVTAGSMHIDMQRVYVEDYSPLMQCSMCLGYGHVRKFCDKKVEKCCHCGGDHKKAECAGWLAGAQPSCLNCIAEDNEVRNHNAFSSACQVRQGRQAPDILP